MAKLPLHDPYLTQSIEALGKKTVIISLQNYASRCHDDAVFCYNSNSLMFAKTKDYQDISAWAYRNARILMGVE